MKEPEQQNKTKDKTTTTTSLNHNIIKLFVTVLDRCAMFWKICMQFCMLFNKPDENTSQKYLCRGHRITLPLCHNLGCT